MVKLIRDIFLFILFGGVVYMLLLAVWGESLPYSYYHNLKYDTATDDNFYFKLKEFEEIDSLNILFLGSSHCYRSFDPRIFRNGSITTFNMGSSAQSHLQTNLILENYLDGKKIDLVVYESYPMIFWNTGIESSLLFIASDLPDDILNPLVLKHKKADVMNSYLFKKYRKAIHGVYRDYEIEEAYVGGGFVEHSAPGYKETTGFDSTKENIFDYQITSFEKNMNFLNSRNIPVLLVEAPMPKAYYNAKPEFEEVEKYLSTKGKFLNYNNRPEFTDSLHFYDYHHLNQSGVEIFNRIFIEDLQELGYDF